MNGDTRLRRFLIGGVLPVLAATLMLAGCGSSSSSSSAGATTSASATGTTPAALSAFQTCLKQHGVKIRPGQFGSARPRASFTPTAFPTGSPRPRPSGSFFGTDSAAFKACAKYAPAGFARGFGRTISASALAAFKSCLTQNGVKVTGKTTAAILAELRSATGKTATAVRTCRVLLQPSAPSPSPST